MLSAKKQWILFYICLMLFITLSLFSNSQFFRNIDNAVYLWLVSHNSQAIFTMMEWVTKIGSGEIIILLTFIIAGVFAYKKWWAYSGFLLTVVIGGIALNFILKVLFQRPRPGDEVKELEVFGYSLEMTSYSFPSGHTMRIVILFTFLIFVSYRFIKRKSLQVISIILLTAIPLLVAISRIMTDAHFFTDIFAAILISIAWFQVCHAVFGKILEKFQFDKQTNFL